MLTTEEEADILFPDALPANDLVRPLPPALNARCEAAARILMMEHKVGCSIECSKVLEHLIRKNRLSVR